MKEGYWVIRTYISGNIGEKIKYYLEGEKPTKSERKVKSDIKKIQQNEASTIKESARLLNANFTSEDSLFGLDYSEEAYNRLLKRIESWGIDISILSEEEFSILIRKSADKELENYFRRCKNAAPKGTVFKYYSVTSDMDGKTGETVRVHHHVVISKNMLEICLSKWNNANTVDSEYVWDEPDHLALANYLIKQVRYVKDEKKYKASRNLVRPVPKDKAALGGAELRVPKHCALLYRGEFKPGMPQYIRYILPPKALADRDREKDKNDSGPYGNGNGGERYEE